MSIKEKILTYFSPTKFIEANPLRGKEKVIKTGAPSIEKACQDFKFTYESTMPLCLTSSANVEKAKETLKALKAKDAYKGLQ